MYICSIEDDTQKSYKYVALFCMVVGILLSLLYKVFVIISGDLVNAGFPLYYLDDALLCIGVERFVLLTTALCYALCYSYYSYMNFVSAIIILLIFTLLICGIIFFAGLLGFLIPITPLGIFLLFVVLFYNWETYKLFNRLGLTYCGSGG